MASKGDFDALTAGAEADRRGLGPIATREFMMGAAEFFGEWVPRPSPKFVSRRSEGFSWAARVTAPSA